MISTVLLWVMAAIGAFLFVYAFLDNENRVFGHIFASGVAMVLFFLLGTLVISGNVGDASVGALNTTTVDNNTTYAYTTVTIPMEYPAVGWVFIFIGVVMLFFVIMAVVEIIHDTATGGGGDDEWEE